MTITRITIKGRSLSWTPIRQGNIYCSPACGRGCTMAEYLLAKRKAEALAKRMGPGWTILLNENLGWFYSVASPDGVCRIHGGNRRGDSFFIDVGNNKTGQICVSVHSDLKKALMEVQWKMKQHIDRCASVVQALEMISSLKVLKK